MTTPDSIATPHPNPKGNTMTTTPIKPRKSMRHTIAGARSMVRSVTRRIEADHLEPSTEWELPELVELVELQAAADAALAAGVATLRDHHGYSWAQIGDELGISRQAAQQRFGR